MIFGIIIVLLVGVIAFFHFVQGFFGAMLSAIFAIIAAVFAFSYHETIVESLLGGRMGNVAHAMVLLVLFAVIYLILRLTFDNLVPGNVRLPFAVDKIGAAAMGVVAGIFAAGIVAIAAQELPFSAGIAGYARYDVSPERPTMVPMINGRNTDSKMWDSLTTDKPGEFGDQHGLIIPVDDIVVGLVHKLSGADGALEDGRPLAAIHPDFLQELFGQRVGTETGADRVAMNLPSQHLEAVKLVGLYIVPSNIPEKDPEYPKIRNSGPLKDTVRPKPSEEFLVVRVMFTKQAGDQDAIVRFSTGSSRLVVPKRGEEADYVNVYPVGTLDSAVSKLLLNKLDDWLYVSVKEGDKGADLVYVVDKAQFPIGKTPPADTFVEIKRLARVDASDQKIKDLPPRDENIDVLRKPRALDPNWDPNQQFNPPAPPPQAQSSQGQPQAAPAAAAKPSFQYVGATVSADLPVPITAPAGATGFTQVPGGTATLKEGKADALEVTSANAAQTQGTTISEAFVPPGQVMVKVLGNADPSAPSQWQCITEADQIELVDSTGKHYQPVGVYASYNTGRADKFIMQYISKPRPASGFAQPPDANGGPRNVTFMFLVPQGSTINEMDDHKLKIQQLSLTANK